MAEPSVNTGGADQVCIKELEGKASADEFIIKTLEKQCSRNLKQIAVLEDKVEELKAELTEVKRITRFREAK